MLIKTQALALLLLFSTTWLIPLETNAQITGRVTDADHQAIPQVNVKILHSDLGTQTNAQGEYAIDASPGDKLLFSHIAMEPEEISVKRNDFVINVEMKPTSIELEEVEIKKKRAKVGFLTQKEMLKAFPENKRLIKTAYGIINTDIASGRIRIIDGEDLVPGLPITQALYGHLHTPHFFRTWFDVDGFLFNEEPTHINSTDVDRVAVLGGYETMKRYGAQGLGSVIVINTKAQTWLDNMGVDRSEEHKQLLDSAMKVTHLEPYQPVVPIYLEKLQKVRSGRKALAIVEKQQSNHLSDPYYFLEIYELYLSRWGNNEKTKELSEYILINFSENTSVIKALAYIKQRHGYYVDALVLFIEILKLQSWHAQALRDVANAYAEIGEIENAWWYYSQYINILDQFSDATFDPYGKDQLITTEMMNILELNKDVIFDHDSILTRIDDHNPQTRLVFEWNRPEAEFALQFVTPEGYYDTWSNKEEELERQNPLLVKAYSSHQFFIGTENIGLWQVNMDYWGNSTVMPTYLKVSVYRDYGLASQKNEIKIFKLTGEHDKVQLFTFFQD